MLNLLGLFVENAKENVSKALTIMWQGVLAIFVVIGIIILITYVLNKVTTPKKKNKDDTENS
jgi:uncharacterized membrane protein